MTCPGFVLARYNWIGTISPSFRSPLWPGGHSFRLRCPLSFLAFFNKRQLPDTDHACLACLASCPPPCIPVAAAQPAPQPLPGGLTRNGDVVMMQPIPDGSSLAEGETLSGPHPSQLRVLPAADHDLLVRAFEAAGRGDWAAARSLAAQGAKPGRQAAAGMALCAWTRTAAPAFAEIDAVIKDRRARLAVARHPAGPRRGRDWTRTCRRPRWSPGSPARIPIPPSAISGWARRWSPPATRHAAGARSAGAGPKAASIPPSNRQSWTRTLLTHARKRPRAAGRV